MTLATKIAVLKDGELQQVGSPHEVYNTPANLFVADFMGSPSMNLLEGKVDAQRRRRRRSCSSAAIIRRSCCRCPPSADASKLNDGAKVIFGIRPEAVNDPEASTRTPSRSRPSTPCRDRRARGLGHVCRDARAGKEVTARMRADTVCASARTTLSRSISTRRCCSIPRRTRGSERSRADGIGDNAGEELRPTSSIVGSGMGGATLAAGLAPSGAQILILERGEQLEDTPETRDARAIFQRGVFRPNETWTDGAGPPSIPATIITSAATASSTAPC